jgi:hypothetical protein
MIPFRNDAVIFHNYRVIARTFFEEKEAVEGIFQK